MFLSFSILDDFFRCPKKFGFWVFCVHPETILPDGLETSGRREYRKFLHILEFLHFGGFFPFFKKNGFLGIIGSPYCGIGATIRIGREMLCLPYVGFLFINYLIFC